MTGIAAYTLHRSLRILDRLGGLGCGVFGQVLSLFRGSLTPEIAQEVQGEFFCTLCEKCPNGFALVPSPMIKLIRHDKQPPTWTLESICYHETVIVQAALPIVSIVVPVEITL